MKKILLSFLLLLLCAGAQAQFAPFVPNQKLTAEQLNFAFSQFLPISGGTVSNVNITGGTITGLSAPIPVASGGTGANTANGALTALGGVSSANPNFTGSINVSGANALTISPISAYNPATFIGPKAGVNYPSTSLWAVGVGAYSAFSLNQSQAEVTAIGTLSCARLTTGNYNVCLGLHSLGSDPAANSTTAVGNDAVRNEIGGGNITAVGANSMRNGSGDQTTAIGSGALRGNGSSITFGGTITAGLPVTITATCNTVGACGNSPGTWSYTPTGSDTIATMIASLANAINAAPINETAVNGNVLIAMQARAPQLGPTNVLSLDFPGAVASGWNVSVTVSVGGSTTLTYSIGTGVNSTYNVVIGSFAVDGAAVQNLSNSVFLGQGVAPSLTNSTEEVCIGIQTCFNATTASGNTVMGAWAHQSNATGNYNTVIGDYAGQGAANSNNNVLIGANAGQQMTSGADNTIVGTYTEDGTSKGCITAGSGNVQIGRLSCVTSATSSGQLSIQNAIYGSANNGSGTTVSTGNIGIYQPSPLAMLDVKGHDTSASTYALRINDSNNRTLFSVNDAGVAVSSNGLQLPVTTVAALPTCNTAAKGLLYAVSDATSPTYNGTLTGGGAVSVPVYCNGSSWASH